MCIFRKFGVILVILAMLIVLGIACYPGGEPGPTPSEPGNQPPVISSLTPARTNVLPLDIIEIRCVASDPDGDAITYRWSTTGGKFTETGTETGSVVSWVAPQSYGDYSITVTVEDSKGNVTQATIKLSVVSNHDPQILSLIANPVTVLPQGKSMITCTASDPDNDVLNYSWKASDGSVTGVDKTVTWIAPDREGAFTITVTVDDGKGGHDVRDISVTVLLAQKTAMFTPERDETGTVSSTGDKDTSRTIAGDSETNFGYRAFWSFNLYSLRGTDVKNAKLTFTTKHVAGEPFSANTGLGGLHILAVRYQPGQLPNFSPDTYRELASVMWQPPTGDIDVTELVRNIGLGISASDYLQVEASFIHQTNGNYIAEYVEWSSVILTVTYAKK